MQPSPAPSRLRGQGRSRPPAGSIALLTLLVLFAHGYHPLADDGGLYAAGIKKLLQPRLYSADAVFVTAHTRLSIFEHVMAVLVRITHLPLPWLLLAAHLASIYLFLLGAWRVGARIFSTDDGSTEHRRWGVLLLAACCFTLPVAGTSLFLMDPYLTARSFSTPFSLFALDAALGGAWVEAGLWTGLAASMDFLMGGYLAIFLVAVALATRHMWRQLAAFAGLGVLISAAIFCATRHPQTDLAGNQAALSRSYFFLSSWNWYEYPGLIFPLLLLGIGANRTRGRGTAGELSAAALAVGSGSVLASLCFVHQSDGSFLLARLQVLRSFHMIYLTGLLLAGGLLGTWFFRKKWVAALAYPAILLAMFAGQRLTYPNSNHLEWPWAKPRNRWEQAFLWIRANTPPEAIFALDANYIVDAGEDAQDFRPIAERSAIADWVKDGGVACISRAAEAPWWRQVRASEGLDQATDAARIARMAPLGATWIVLPSAAATNLFCPYQNGAVRVCKLGIR